MTVHIIVNKKETQLERRSKKSFIRTHKDIYKLGGGGVQGQGKGQRLMSNIEVNDYIWLATCQGRIYEK